ncbi:hypothetical protein Val02_10430 [Virgisporangium aliadipatigenens]|uniref:DUF4132 domain-containing protein n=1 Tax=Virgisporangium aliadipatigenens TaxID=741659 RepID=A0A8J4DP66_9ACTN|nr:hypothetical protein Val02_10430 [Virgisporangium aliadipatigenens]
MWPAAWARARYPRRGHHAVAPFVLAEGAADALAALYDKDKNGIGLSLRHERTPVDVREAAAAWIGGAGHPPLGAAAVAAGIAGRTERDSWQRLSVIADAWIGTRGLPFAAAAAAELLTLDGGWRGHNPVSRVPADLYYQVGERPEAALVVAARVRAALAAAPGDAYAQARAALAALRDSVLRDSVTAQDALPLLAATSFLAPTESEWVDADCLALQKALRQGSWFALYLAMAVHTPEQFRRISDDLLPYLLLDDGARLVTFAEGLGAPVADVLAEWIDAEYTSAEHQRRILRTLAVLPYDRAFELLLARVDRRWVEGMLTESMRRFPRRAMRLLAADRRRPVEQLLRVHVAAHPDLVAEAAAALPPADAGRLRALADAVASLVTATPDRLPPLLVSPPWTVAAGPAGSAGRTRAGAPVVAGLACTDPPAVAFTAAERDTWGHRTSDTRGDTLTWERTAEALRGGRKVDDHRARSLFERGPRELGRPVLGAWQPEDLWDAGGWLRHVADRFGVDALPLLVGCARRRPVALAGVLLPFASGDVAALMAGWLGGNRVVRGVATAWLDRHPSAAARHLIPVALGKAGTARRAAERALRTLAARHPAAVEAAAASYDAAALAGVRALLAVDPLEVLPARMPVAPEWADPALHLPLLLRDGSALPTESVRHVVTMLALSRADDPYAGLATVREWCDPESLAEFAWSLFRRWRGSDSASKEQWALEALALVGNDETVRRLAPVIRAWPGESQHARAVAGLDVLAAIGSDVALMHLHGIAERVRFRALREKATEKIDEVAAGLGLSREQLGDRLVPTFGLDPDGGLTLDYGPRRFRVGFDEQLKPYVEDERGKRRTALPKPGARDDATAAEEAFARFAALRKDVRTVAGDQLRRLERAMVEGRRWSGAEFRRHLVEHPLVRHLARRLVWGRWAGDGSLRDALRIAEDRTFAGVDDAPLTLADDDVVGVAHPLLLGDTVPAWSVVFADYEILQPFAQLDREVYAITPEEHAKGRLLRFARKVVPTGKLLGLEHRGWRRGDPMDAGVQSWMQREVPGGLLVVELDPGIAVGAVDALGGEQTLGDVYLAGEDGPYHHTERALSLSRLDPISASEIIRDLSGVTA